MLTQKIQLGEEISVLAKKLAQEGKEVLCEKGFTKEQQEIFEEMFQKCFVSTADTTTKLLENGETYVFTGDIEADVYKRQGIPGSYLFIIGSAFNEEVFRRTDTQRLSGCTYESWHFKNKNRRYNRAG